MANVFTPNGLSCLTAPSLGDISNKKVRVVLNNVTWNFRGTLISQAGAAVESAAFNMYGNPSEGKVVLLFDGGYSMHRTPEAMFGQSTLENDNIEFVRELSGLTTVFVNGVEVASLNTGKDSGGTATGLLRFGAEGNSSTGVTSGLNAVFAESGTQIGDARIYLDDVLVRQYTMPSSPASTTVPESVSGEDATVRDENDPALGNNFTSISSSAPAFGAATKLSQSAGSQVFSASSGPNINYTKLNAPFAFTHVRVHLMSYESADNLTLAVAPTYASTSLTADETYKPHNDNGLVDNSLWQSAAMPTLTALNNGSDIGVSTSEWLPVSAIESSDGKYSLLIRLGGEYTGALNSVSGVSAQNNKPFENWKEERDKAFHNDEIISVITTAGGTDVTAYDSTPTIADNSSTGFLFAVEFGAANNDAGLTRIYNAGASTAVANVEDSKSFGNAIYNPLSLLEDRTDFRKLFVNGAMSSKNSNTFLAHYYRQFDAGMRFDYVIMPTSSGNDGTPDASVRDAMIANQNQLVQHATDNNYNVIFWQHQTRDGYITTSYNFLLEIIDNAKTLAQNNSNVHFIDIGTQVETGGGPPDIRPEFTFDGIHLNYNGANVSASKYEYEFHNIFNYPVTRTQNIFEGNGGKAIELSTLGNMLDKRFRIRAENVTIGTEDGVIFSQATATDANKEFALYKDSGNIYLAMGGNIVDCGSVASIFDTTNALLDVTIVSSGCAISLNGERKFSSSETWGVGRRDGEKFRIGASSADDVGGSELTGWMAQGDSLGYTEVYVDSVLVLDEDVSTLTVTDAPNVNQPPTANAGPDQSVAAGATVQLDGTGSTDSDGTIASYAWTQTAGDTVAITGANTATPSFTAPSTNAQQSLTFELTVTDDGGLTATDSVDVQVAAQVIESTLNAALTGIADGTYLTRVVDTDNDVLLFKDNKAWASGAASFTLPVAVGTNVEYYAYETTENGAGLQIGVTE